jgi:hypothetical protein
MGVTETALTDHLSQHIDTTTIGTSFAKPEVAAFVEFPKDMAQNFTGENTSNNYSAFVKTPEDDIEISENKEQLQEVIEKFQEHRKNMEETLQDVAIPQNASFAKPEGVSIQDIEKDIQNRRSSFVSLDLDSGTQHTIVKNFGPFNTETIKLLGKFLEAAR